MFDHYVALDWAMSNMAIARMTRKSNKINTIDVPSDIGNMKVYLKQLKGPICLTFEETTTSKWLYTELKEYVTKVIVCDPYRNKLLSEGPKTDKIDVNKLVQLLRADLLKEIFHDNNEFVDLRKLSSAYDDTIKAGVRLKNQRSAIFRALNKNHREETELTNKTDKFVLEGLDKGIANYEEERKRYKEEFSKLVKKHPEIKRVSTIPGMGDVFAVKIVSRIVEAHRFKKRNHFLSYCGLIKHEKISGNRSYGRKNPRFCRMMKNVFKSATMAAIGGNNPFSDYYQYLQKEKNYTDYNARHATARKIASITYGIMKGEKKYLPYKRGLNELKEINAEL